jgi:hypothetical protein
MNTQQNLDAIKRLLERKQAIPSQMIRELMIDCKAQMALNNALKKRVTELEMKPVTEKAEAS